MDLIDNDQFDQVDIGPLATFPCDDIPLLGGRHYYVRLLYLLLGQVNVSGELLDFDAERSQPRLKVAHHFGYQSFHRSDVDDLEALRVNHTVLTTVLGQSLQDRQNSDVGFAGTSWRADQHVLWRLERCFIKPTLNGIQRLDFFREGSLSP